MLLPRVGGSKCAGFMPKDCTQCKNAAVVSGGVCIKCPVNYGYLRGVDGGTFFLKYVQLVSFSRASSPGGGLLYSG